MHRHVLVIKTKLIYLCNYITDWKFRTLSNYNYIKSFNDFLINSKLMLINIKNNYNYFRKLYTLQQIFNTNLIFFFFLD